MSARLAAPFVLAAVTLVVVPACEPRITPVTAPSVEFQSALAGKIPGRYALGLDPTTVALERSVQSSTSVCAEQRYPFRPAPALARTLETALRVVFEHVDAAAPRTTPDVSSPAPGTGVIHAWLERFDPKLKCDVDFWGRSCVASVDLTLGLEVRMAYGRSLSFTASSTESAEGGAGGACQDVSDVLGEAYALALRDVVHTALEEIAASESLHPPAAR